MAACAHGVETDLCPDASAHGSSGDSSHPPAPTMGDVPGRVGPEHDGTLAPTEYLVSGNPSVTYPVSQGVLVGSPPSVEMGVAGSPTGKEEDPPTDPTHLDAPVECVVCLHGESDEQSVNEDMPAAVR